VRVRPSPETGPAVAPRMPKRGEGRPPCRPFFVLVECLESLSLGVAARTKQRVHEAPGRRLPSALGRRVCGRQELSEAASPVELSAGRLESDVRGLQRTSDEAVQGNRRVPHLRGRLLLYDNNITSRQ
jgi:hypothetical protein